MTREGERVYRVAGSDRRISSVTITRTRPVTDLAPNWFASVMGTGIVAVAAAGLPWQVPGLRTIATAIWLVAAGLLVTLGARVRRATIRRYADDPVLIHFWGAPPMALMTVGAGTLLLGRDVIGLSAAVAVDLVLWTAGTILGLITAVAVPYRMITRPDRGQPADRGQSAGRGRSAGGEPFGGWLMPVVPPMVSAATGALLIPYVSNGADLRLVCGALFGVSLIASLVIIAQIWGRLLSHGAGAARMVPTLWIVLGPLGQSVTAVHLLAGDHTAVVVLYGVPVIGFALFWAALAAACTVRAARAGLPFSLTWWSFTFPVGTVVTALSGLAARTGSRGAEVLAMALYAMLVAAWLVVAVRTLRDFRLLTR
jgi:tellurite resistance protein TehA-like permease